MLRSCWLVVVFLGAVLAEGCTKRPETTTPPREAAADVKRSTVGVAAEENTHKGSPGTFLSEAEEMPSFPESEAMPSDAATDATNSIGMQLKLIPPGEFLMGSQESPEDTAAFFHMTTSRGSPADEYRNEHPQHRVRITKPFYLGVYHVTRGQFRKFVEDTGYQTDAEKRGGAMGLDIENSHLPWLKRYAFFQDRSWRNVGYTQPDNHPVVNVSWDDAMAFCRWLSVKERKSYRLPTEAEWEYACRAGTTTRYYSGDDAYGTDTMPTKVTEATRADGMVVGAEEYVFTAQVGTLGRNLFGLCDMHGNARQWCADRYDAEYYTKSPAEDPPGPPSGLYRVIRGSFLESTPDRIRSAYRGWDLPSNRHYSTGFRVARAN